MQKLGGTRQNVYIDFIDGQYAVCLDRLLPKMLSMSMANSCLVYSFGVNDDWSFDDALHGRGCEVHSFDPSSGGPSHKRGLRHWFHAWGLGTRINALKPKWKMLTYAQIRQKLGHEGRPVDVLKLDMEGSEWSFLESTLMDHPSMLDAVDQLIMEIHPEGFEGMQARVIRQRSLLLHHLEKRGFTLFKSRVNVNGPNLRSFDFSKRLNETQGHFMYELSFIKI
ncbi:putative Methyltransferase-like protein 24 [Hypsibius exemplaris]|uniref:Methyltransferase-like protein 24 n=1 Tax=Hypsibius exemplaris TaxID=2072580 RepID=A0A9X6RKN7_HYPEX|nr:putative Methyltransferase-like protein 24 [Hypsibius exemplaris]